MMVTLFLGFAKRRAEMGAASEAGSQRRVLEHYTPVMLDIMIAISAASAVIAYSLYTVSPHAVALHGSENLIYTTPFILYGMFRYLFVLYSANQGEDPASDLFREPHILVTVLLWLVTTTLIIA